MSLKAGFAEVDITPPVGIEKIGWKNALLTTGKFAEAKIDYLVEGEGVSAFAASIHGLISCRARVELRLIPVPGRNIVLAEKGVAGEVEGALTRRRSRPSPGCGPRP